MFALRSRAVRSRAVESSLAPSSSSVAASTICGRRSRGLAPSRRLPARGRRARGRGPRLAQRHEGERGADRRRDGRSRPGDSVELGGTVIEVEGRADRDAGGRARGGRSAAAVTRVASAGPRAGSRLPPSRRCRGGGRAPPGHRAVRRRRRLDLDRRAAGPEEVKALIGECVSRMARAVEQFGGVVDAFMGDGDRRVLRRPGRPRGRSGAGRPGGAAHRPRRRRVRARHRGGLGHRGLQRPRRPEQRAGGRRPRRRREAPVRRARRHRERRRPAPERRRARIGRGRRGDRAAARRPVRVRGARRHLGQGTRGAGLDLAPRAVRCRVSRRVAPTPLVGRDAELERLTVPATTCSRGAARCSSSSATPGSARRGSWPSCAGSPATRSSGSRATASPTEPSSAFCPWSRPCAAGSGSRRARRRSRSGRGSGSSWSRSSATVLDEQPAAPRIAARRASATSSARCAESHAEDVRRACCEWIEALAATMPVALVFEDFQWADPWTCDLAHDLLQVVERAPLLLAASFRIAPQSDGWRFRVSVLAEHPHRSVELPLAPLSNDEAVQLLSVLAPSGLGGHFTGRDRPPRRGQPALSRAAPADGARAGWARAATAVDAEPERDAGRARRPREPAPLADRQPARLGSPGRAGGGDHRPQLPLLGPEARLPGRIARGRPQRPRPCRSDPRAAAIPGARVHASRTVCCGRPRSRR